MPYYKCTFLNDAGQFTHRTIFSDNKMEIRKNFERADQKLVKIRTDFLRGFSLFKIFARKVGYSEFLAFNQKLIVLLKSGVSFIQAMDLIVKNLKEGTLKEILKKTQTDIHNGIPISDAFSSSQIPFHRIYRATLFAGEKSGNIESLLEKFNVYLQRLTQLRRKTFSSLMYPLLVLTAMLVMVFVILVWVVPVFSEFYSEFDAELPGITLLLISVANFFKDHIFWILGGVLAVFLTIHFIQKHAREFYFIDLLMLKLPFIGMVFYENAMSVFSRTLSILISGGIPVPESLGVAVGTFSNRYFAMKVADLPTKIKEGVLLSDTLSEVDIFPPIMTDMIRIGESSGNLVEVLDQNADYFESTIDTRINTFVSLIEPVLLLLLALGVMFMLVAVYLPIFNSARVVQ